MYTATVSNEACSVSRSLFVDVYDDLSNELQDIVDITIVEDTIGGINTISFNEEEIVQQLGIESFRWEVTIDDLMTEIVQNPINFGIVASDTIFLDLVLIDSNGCETIIQDFIAPPIPEGVMAIFDPINLCSGDSTTSVEIIPITEGQEVSVVWEPSANIIGQLTDNPVVVRASTGEDEIILNYVATIGATEFPGEVIVPVEDELIIQLTGDSQTCDGSANFEATSNVPNTIFEWSLSEDFAEIVDTGSMIQIALDDNLTVFVRGRTESGCMSDVLSMVVEMIRPVMDENYPSRICVGDTFEISLTGINAEEIEVIWDPSPAIIGNLISSTISVVAIEGIDTLCLSYAATTLDGECTGEGEICIPYSTDDPPVPSIDLNCTDYGAQFSVQEFFNDGDLLWDFGEFDDESDQSTNASPSYVYSGPGDYEVRISSNTGTCEFEPVLLETTIPEIIQLSTSDPLSEMRCNDEEEVLTRSVFTNTESPVVWTDQDGNQVGEGDTISIVAEGISTLTATASNEQGCDTAITFEFDTYQFDIDIQTPDQNPCPGESFEVNITNNSTDSLAYEWSPAALVVSGGNTANPTLNLTESGEVTLTVTNPELGCMEEFVTSFDIGNLEVIASADPDAEIFLGESVSITVDDDGSNSTYSWSNGSTNQTQTVTPTETTTYAVTVTDEFGCTGTDEITITVIQPLCDESDIFLPLAFSPNGDGNNDELFVRSNFVQSMELKVVSRWGQVVFETRDQLEGWNGRFQNTGQELGPQVFAYSLRVVCTNGEEFIKSGNVSLLR